MIIVLDYFLYQNDIPYYDGPREDDRPYAYISKLVEKNIELKVFKMIKLSNHKFKMYIEIDNLLNEFIPRRINPYTGEGYDLGSIFGYNLANSPNPNLDPSRFNRPRSIETGIQYNF